jgi:glycerophosphoryl diester phosphodiesterase
MKRFYQIVTLVLAALILVPTAVQAQKKEKVGIVAHRGFWNCDEAGYAKNSIAALRCAQEAGCWGSEFDVNMTSDGVLLVYHDGNVEGVSIEKNPHSAFRTTDSRTESLSLQSTNTSSRQRNILTPYSHMSSSLILAQRWRTSSLNSQYRNSRSTISLILRE